MRGRTRVRTLLLPLALAGLAASPYVPWQELSEADWIYSLATRTSTLDGHAVHYPTPTQELHDALAGQAEMAALRHLAEARLELGDRPGALLALERWAAASGPEAWAETARWAASHDAWAAAFKAAASALPNLPPSERRKLADQQIEWADAQPDFADALALRQRRVELFPEDSDALEDWLGALEEAGRLTEVEAALQQAKALREEARLAIRSDLLFEHGDKRRAFELLDGALVPEAESLGFSPEWRKLYVARVDAGNPAAPEAWRATLDRGFDARALVRLATYFEGQERGDAALDLLRQVERRFEAGLDRQGFLQLARHYGEIDAVPEAFRARLQAAQKASPEEQQADLAALVRLALRAGGRALPWGVYNDEPYRWVARVDRTPGFWTGGVAFLLTGQDWQEALAQLEAESLPERTFKTARLLLDELARRAPTKRELPELRALVMARHVERGEGQAALKLLPLVETGSPEAQQIGRRTALLAMRQVEVPVAEELRLYKAQLRLLAPDGSRPELGTEYHSSWIDPSLPQAKQRFLRHRTRSEGPSYQQLLTEAQSRLDERDATHRATLDLLLGELDRLPEAEDLWSNFSERISSWNLDDELGPRYEAALKRFSGADWWQRLARWYARRSRHAELRKLADELVQRFRSSELFGRVNGVPASVEIPEQPRVGARIRLVPWADWVRLKALERFPHSPTVYRQALAHLQTPERARHGFKPPLAGGEQPVMTDDTLLETRRYALLYTDAQERGEYLAAKMRAGGLAGFLEGLESLPQRTPVEERLLFDGWTRLSQFERAAQPADRLAATYPGDGELAGQALTLHRSLATLDPSHAAPARAVVERVLEALQDPSGLITELGELEQERGRGEAAQATWARLVAREPKSAKRVEELATVLWDYGYMRPALDAIEQGRQRLKEPWLLAFEAGVLREELRDIDGAVDEYLASARPNRAQCFCEWFETDQRALRRLSQLSARERVRTRLLERIARFQPGVAKDEQALVALLPLPTIQQPDTSLDATVDDWIDSLDQPNDPLGRGERKEARERWLPEAREATKPIGDALLTRVLAMLPKATSPEFLDKLAEWRSALLDGRWARERELDFDNALLRRRAELLPSEEQRVAKEVERARFLLERGRRGESDTLWAALASRIDALPQGAPRMRAEAERVAYVERTRGADAAAGEWRALVARYPWSLGLLEDRLAFLNRNGRGAEARQTLAEVAPRAAAGHRESLLERLAKEALEARDLPMARRAVEGLMAESSLTEGQRLGALHLLARLRLREPEKSDLLALAKAEAPKLPAERLADVYEQLARAADAEKQFGAAQALWIEALNRRLEREWLKAAFRSAERGSTTAELRAFFERQRERSPRDVRWAVAVRELRVLSQDLEGAIAMAKAAVAVRPERESLWREAVELIERAGRLAEAADYLAGWHEPRPADEGVAGWRAGLYARAGQDDKALAIEQAALSAFGQQREEQPDEETDELGERRVRAARRLWGAGLPQKAWKLLCPTDDPGSLAESSMPAWEQAELALSNSRFIRLLRAHAGDGDDEFRTAAASAFDGQARPEQREELVAFLKGQLFPGAAARNWPGQAQALAVYWPLSEQAGVQSALRDALARRYVASRPGPWNPEPPTDVLEAVGRAVVQSDRNGRLQFESPELDVLWVRHLAERDRASELGAFLSPRWGALVVKVFAETPVRKDEVPQDWTRYLDDPGTLQLFARWLQSEPERLAELQRMFAERKRWDRLWALGARRWNVAALVTALPDESREAWFRIWLQPSPSDADPVLAARGQTLEAATVALGRLVTGAPQAAGDPVIAKLRGPRTLGDVLGQDPRWLFPEFAPRALVNGQGADQGEALVVGRGADAGRLPGVLWGERPGNAWYVLETLARYREGSAGAALVPLEVRERGREAERTRLAARLADALGDNALALEIEGGGSVSSLDLLRFESQLRRLLGRARPEAEQALRTELRRRQQRLDEPSWRALRRLAEDLGLPPAFELLARDEPVAAGLLALLYEQRGAAACAGLKPADAVAFRSALLRRWSGRERTLPAADVRFWLDELWATGATDSVPRPGLVKLGGLWPAAADWLSTLPQPVRAEGLAALTALPDDARLEGLMASQAVAHEDVVRLLRLRVRLTKGDEAGALQLFAGLMGELRREAPLTYAAVSLSESAPSDEGEGEWSEEEGTASADTPSSDPLSARLSAWVLPFKAAGKQALVAAEVEALLAEKRQDGFVPLPAWRLALDLATPEQRAALLLELERAYVRGELTASRELVEIVGAHFPAELHRWLKRWPEDFAFDSVSRRAALLAGIKDGEGAARTLIVGRQKGKWTAVDEVRAFDQWRRVAPEPRTGAKPAAAPATWLLARSFWKRKASEMQADLGAHLAQHPLDVLSARAVLRTAAPAEEQGLRRAQLSLRSGTLDKFGNSWADARFVQLRIARGLLASSARAALRQLGNAITEEKELRQRGLPRAEIAAALTDIARMTLGAAEPARVETAMAALEDVDAAEAARLRQAAPSLRPPSPVRPYRLDATGQPQPIRPRDLDWPVLLAVLAEEPKR